MREEMMNRVAEAVMEKFEQKEALKKAVGHYERLTEIDRVQAVIQIVVTGEDIDDIMAGALEGGISYWCNRAEVVGDYLGKYASEQISRGGRLLLYDIEEDESYMLDKEKVLKGLKMYIENPHPYEILNEIDNELRVDTGNADATVCDMIIQYALFDDVIYG